MQRGLEYLLAQSLALVQLVLRERLALQRADLQLQRRQRLRLLLKLRVAAVSTSGGKRQRRQQQQQQQPHPHPHLAEVLHAQLVANLDQRWHIHSRHGVQQRSADNADTFLRTRITNVLYISPPKQYPSLRISAEL